MRKLSGLRLIM